MSIDETETVTLTPTSAIKALGLTVESVFVPWSQSRNFKPIAKTADRSLNWRVTVKRNGREVLTSDYQAGIGHLDKGASQNGRPGYTADDIHRIERETETGFRFRDPSNSGAGWLDRKAPYMPEAEDVIYSLLSDSSALDHPTFESWASDFGFDPDSRKGESIYRACLEIGLKMRGALGDAGLKTLQTAFQDY